MEFNSDRPIFLQLAQQLKDAILSGIYAEDSQIPSITEYSVTYKINPATALKGINILVDEGLIYKKRGVGMFVASGAKTKLLQNRQDGFYESCIIPLIKEAKSLKLEKSELLAMIERGFDNGN